MTLCIYKSGIIRYDNKPNNIIVKPINKPIFFIIFLRLNFFLELCIKLFEIFINIMYNTIIVISMSS